MAGQAISPRQPSDRTLPEADDIALPIDGWHLRHRVQANGRTCIEITDYLGDLAALIASTTLPILSVDAAWRGQGHDADRERQWWAIAIGHATVSDVEGPVVTFTRPVGRQQLHRRAVVQPLQSQGLWIASVPGLYAAVSCRQESRDTVRRLVSTARERRPESQGVSMHEGRESSEIDLNVFWDMARSDC
jgi:hypothetical protein